jgi:hypothetical protein
MNFLTDYEQDWAELCTNESKRCSPEYWNSRAEDYADFIVNSDFDHGRKILELFKKEGLINQDMHIMDIGSGPGAISIPFAEEVRAITAVEPADEMANQLLKQAALKSLSNISVIPHIWQEVNTGDLEKKIDMTICCHSVWHFPDLFTQIERMQQVSRGYCVLSHGVYTPDDSSQLIQKLGMPQDDEDRFILVKRILENRGIFPESSILPVKMRRTIGSARSMLILGLKKYREPEIQDLNLIEEHLMMNVKNGMYEREGKMGVLWWRVS